MLRHIVHDGQHNSPAYKRFGITLQYTIESIYCYTIQRDRVYSVRIGHCIFFFPKQAALSSDNAQTPFHDAGM